VPWQTSAYFKCESAAPARARRFCSRSLSEALEPFEATPALIDQAEVIVSELVTNALKAACSRTELHLSVSESRVRIEVHDDAPGEPTVQNPSPEDVNGRGLMIVSTLAAAWGVENLTVGKGVWAELAVSGAS
jgi:anti-sigma regulatory factor (Ser/Thr protein kinase)